MSESMIELVTKAIQAVGIERQNVAYSDYARAAIEAMREPTEAMLLSTKRIWIDPRVSAACWERMIDAALSEGT